MAEAVIATIAQGILAQLIPEALEKVSQFSGVKRELAELQNTVRTLQAVLDDAEEQYDQSHQIRDWLGRVKDVLYEAQDILEEVNIEAMRGELRGPHETINEVRTFLSHSNQLAFRRSISKKVREVRERIEAVGADRRFHLNERPQRELREREERHPIISEGDIKGRDEDKKTVMNFLLDSNTQEPISILPIVGIGGLGKTTLARFVYDDEMVTKHFDLKMWVCVSDNFDVKKIVEEMIACAKNEEPSKVAMNQLQSKLKAEIDGKKYLLVLDDLWITKQEPWVKLKTLLVGGARGSKILITTRLPLIAEITSTTPHSLKGLSEGVSLDVLMQMACPKQEERQDLDLLAIGKEIARKCHGVPLVVRTVGSLLLFKKTKAEWLHFKDYEMSKVSEREDIIRSVLRLSYDHLPSHLKQCFALCSLFPKDYEIKKETLINLWMAEGFIQPSYKNQHLEDVANEYFLDLLWRNFFQNYQKDKETCKMHDLMHDLACLVAGTEYWVPWDDKKTIHGRTRHVSWDDLPISRLKASPLRTFLSHGKQQIKEADLHQIIQRFKSLRILDMRYTYVGKVPRSICELKYLTYLDLSSNRQLKKLPNSITKLHNLQTLNLNGCSALKKLPSGIRELVSLRNLDIDGSWELSYMPCGLGQLSSLHKLTRFILPKERAVAKNHCRLGELNGLNNIRGSLCIENLESITATVVESKAANLMGKHSLEYLELQWGDLDSGDTKIGDKDEVLLDGLRPHSNLKELMIKGYKGGSFPRWMRDSLVSSLPNLVVLRLSNCTRCRSLPQLGQLPHLKSLSIKYMTELEYIASDHSSTLTESFPSLSTLVIEKCGNLKAMPRAPHLTDLNLRWANPVLINLIFGFNKLKRLLIEYTEFPECLSDKCWKNLTSLESLNIRDCHRLTSLGVRYLSSLVDLSIWYCKELDLCIGNSGNIILDFHGLPSLRSVDILGLPKLGESLPQWLLQSSNLERLSIRSCINLKELPEQIEALQSLQRLDIIDCCRLTSLSVRYLPSLVDLDIRDCEELDLCKGESGNIILDFHELPSLRSVVIYNLPKLGASLPQWLLQASNLECLSIESCVNLKELPEQIEALQSLQRLNIVNCCRLTSLGMRYLSSLVDLTILRCEELDLCKGESSNIILDSHRLPSLRSVYIAHLPKLGASLPHWLLQASNLERLYIRKCDNLKELPEQIKTLQSLQRLGIVDCPSLTLLPEAMRRLASLTRLHISGCPELEKRCKRDEGEDWCKISHIPDISHGSCFTF